jgi:hypothetical protein
MWSHKIFPCPFFSLPSKKQLRTCSVLKKKSLLWRVVVCERRKLRMSQFEQWKNIKFCQKWDKYSSETFQMIRQSYSKKALALAMCFKWHKHLDVLHRRETVWKMMSIPVSQEWSELNSRSKKLQRWCLHIVYKIYGHVCSVIFFITFSLRYLVTAQ